MPRSTSPRTSATTLTPWRRTAAACGRRSRCRGNLRGSRRCTAARSRSCPGRCRLRRMQRPRAYRASCAPCWSRTACPCYSRAAVATASASRTPAGAASPPESSRRRSLRSARSPPGWSPGSAPASARRHSRWARKCARRSWPGRAGRFMADLPALARRRLAVCGVHDVHGGAMCTHADAARFYSYRRDGETGRMAALIWLQ